MSGASDTCACGIFAIGICQECGSPTCGDCARKIQGRLTCASCFDTHQRELRDQALHEKERVERARTAWENERIEYSAEQAFETLFLKDADLREINSAELALSRLSFQEFVDAALRCLPRSEFPLYAGTFHKGSRRGIYGTLATKARAFECWWISFGSYLGGNSYFGICPDGSWIKASSGGEGYSSWSKQERHEMTEKELAELIRVFSSGRKFDGMRETNPNFARAVCLRPPPDFSST